MPSRVPRAIPDEEFNEIFARLPSHRDRALVVGLDLPAFPDHGRRGGLLVLKFHGARHTAAPLALQAQVDVKIVSETLGHSNERITRDLYQHV